MRFHCTDSDSFFKDEMHGKDSILSFLDSEERKVIFTKRQDGQGQEIFACLGCDGIIDLPDLEGLSIL